MATLYFSSVGKTAKNSMYIIKIDQIVTWKIQSNLIKIAM